MDRGAKFRRCAQWEDYALHSDLHSRLSLLGLLTGVLAKAYVLVTDSCLALRARLRRARSELLTLGIHPLQ
jgi:hypothetical protein